MKGSNNYRKFTPEEDAFLAGNYPQMSRALIARKLNRSKASVDARMKRLGMELNRRKFFMEKDIEFLKANYDKMTSAELGRALGRHPNNIVCKLKSMGLKAKRVCKPFSQEEDDFILANYNNLSIRKIAEMLGRPKTSAQNRYNKLKEKHKLEPKKYYRYSYMRFIPKVEKKKPEVVQKVKEVKYIELKPRPKMLVVPERRMKVKEEPPKPFIRPKAEYSNKGYEYLLNKYS